MRRTGRNALLVLVCLALAGSSGCFADPRTSNQGGGSLITAGTKVAAGNIGTLTADEWQILCDNAPNFAPQFAVQYGVDLSTVVWPVLNDEQAQTVVDFLAASGITTYTQLEAAIRTGNLQIPDSLLELFQSAVESQGV